jgi:copper transport protein
LLGTVLTTKFGRVWAGKGLLFLVALPVLWAITTQGASAVRSIGWRIAATVVVVGLIRTPGLIGHASEGPYAVLGSTADLIHMAGVALWIGGLAFVCIVVLPRRRPDELTEILPRFSMLASIAVPAIVIAGTFMSWQLIGSIHGLLDSPFGHVLLIKLAAFTAVLALAQSSRRWVHHRLDPPLGHDTGIAAIRPFVLCVGAEAVLALAVLGVASVLVSTSPIR